VTSSELRMVTTRGSFQEREFGQNPAQHKAASGRGAVSHQRVAGIGIDQPMHQTRSHRHVTLARGGIGDVRIALMTRRRCMVSAKVTTSSVRSSHPGQRRSCGR